MCFLHFLMQARSTLGRYLHAEKATGSETNLRKLHIVLGNESCDLDSAVSALTLAFIYAQRQQEHDFLPVLNIPRIDYPLKTEVRHMLNKCEIDAQLLLFRDDLPEQLRSDISVILVDHHVSSSSLAPLVSEILDHRPLDKQHPVLQLLPTHCVRHIEPEVGSCATLVAERYLAEEQPRSCCVSRLLHATIVLDTINFSPAARRFCARDLAMVELLEQQQQQGTETTVNDDEDVQLQRVQLFEELVAARADISQLSLAEVLRKDAKQLRTQRNNLPLAGLPMLVRDFIELPDAELAIRQFADDSQLLIILGMFVAPGTGQVQRDVALIPLSPPCPLLERVRRALLDCQSPALQLQPHAADSSFMGGCFMRQLNVQATRKHILPVVQRVLTEWEAAEEATQHCDCDDVYFFKEKLRDYELVFVYWPHTVHAHNELIHKFIIIVIAFNRWRHRMRWPHWLHCSRSTAKWFEQRVDPRSKHWCTNRTTPQCNCNRR